MGLDKCTVSIHHYGIIQNDFATLNISFFLPVHTPSPHFTPQPLATTFLFTISIVFAFSRISYTQPQIACIVFRTALSLVIYITQDSDTIRPIHDLLLSKNPDSLTIQLSRSVMSNSLWPHGLQHTRPPCPSPTPATCSDSCPLSRWCHPPSHPLSSPSPPASIFPSIRHFPNELALCIRWPKYWSFNISLPMNIQDWIPLELTGLISLQSKGLSKVFSKPKASILYSDFFMVQLSYPYMTIRKTIALIIQTFVSKEMSLLFNMLSRLNIAFLPRSKCLLISWLQSPSAVILEPKKIKSHCFDCFPIYLPWSHGTRCHDLCFLNVECYASFFTLLFHFHQEAL